MGLYIICPYYKRDRKKSITCEDTIRSYETITDKKKVLNSYCSASWKQCPYAKRMNDIYSLDMPFEKIKEKIMKNKIEQQDKEINKLMRENGQLKKKVDKFQAEIKRRDEVEKKNHEMYRESLERKESLLKAKDENIKRLESLASAFLVIAYGNDTREIHISKDKIAKLMTEFQLSYKIDEDGMGFTFCVDKVKGGQ